MGYKRLTARSPKNSMAYLVNVRPNEQSVESPYPNTLRCIMDCFNRLAAYEDSGLSPEQVKELAEGKLIYESYEGSKLDKADQEIERLEGELQQYKEFAKKVKPMKPIPNKRSDFIGKCPVCKTELCTDDKDLHYCPTCGQALAIGGGE